MVLLLLDTRDLINVLERGRPCDVGLLSAHLNHGDHRLNLTSHGVTELSAPLEHGQSERTSVMKTLNRLEELPLVYLAEHEIISGELTHAIAAFEIGKEPAYQPRVESRLDLAVAPHGDNRYFLSYSLAECVFELWTTEPEMFRPQNRRTTMLQDALDGDRGIHTLPLMKARFGATVLRHLGLYNIPVPQDFDSFATWLYASPKRSPATRLGFDVFQIMLNDRNTPAEASHFVDLYNITCLPYVDLITLDAHMRSYVGTATTRLGEDFGTEVLADTSAVLQKLPL